MLSRVADSIYWMSRYIERAENTARLLDVNLQLMLDFEGMDDASLTSHWMPIVACSGQLELFEKLYSSTDSKSVQEFMTFNRENPNSILSCLRAARAFWPSCIPSTTPHAMASTFFTAPPISAPTRSFERRRRQSLSSTRSKSS